MSAEAAPTVSIKLRHLHAQIFHFAQLDSTNNYLKDYARQQQHEKIPSPLEGITIIADEQTAGRGRMARQWHSPAKDGLYFSILLTPQIDIQQISLLTLMAAIAVAEAIYAFSPDGIDIKWPNDILIKRRKVAGILTESQLEGLNISYIIIGIGVNLYHKYFPAEINRQATSLYLESGKMIDKDKFVFELLSRLDHWYGVLKNAPAGIIERWQHLSSFATGKKIRIIEDNQEIIGHSCGVENSGALRVKLSDNRIISLFGSEITAIEDEE